MNFMIGCNYWASDSGTEMWKKWNEQTVDKDFAHLKEYGMEYIRVFPIWRDFQPIEPCYHYGMQLHEYRMSDGTLPKNPYYIDEDSIKKFRTLCCLAQKHGLRLIVGIVTGWMSGRMFVPPALYNMNLITDARATALTVKYIKGFVEMTKDMPAIYAWDLGNECNCISDVSNRSEAYTWTAMVSNTIKAADNTRQVISGMHGLRIDNAWTIADQGELTDILTTHPYPYWGAHTRADFTVSTHTFLHAAAEGELYTSLGGKPVLVEEVGTMGPEVCSDEAAATFMRCQLFSAWATGQAGLLWWCAFDQNEFDYAPYAWNMIERYLGLFRTGYQPKPALIEMKRFADAIKHLPTPLPKKDVDAVCLLSRDINHWGVAYSTYSLASQAGISITFADVKASVPESKLYILPSINGIEVMDKTKYDELKARVYNGSTLYISNNNAILTEFEEFIGARIVDSCNVAKNRAISLCGNEEILESAVERILAPTTAEIILTDKEGAPMLLKNKYGKGYVYYLDAPLEASLIDKHGAIDSGKYKIYNLFAKEITTSKTVITNNPALRITYHSNDEDTYVVIINYSDKKQDSALVWNKNAKYDVIYGTLDTIDPGDACVLKIK